MQSRIQKLRATTVQQEQNQEQYQQQQSAQRPQEAQTSPGLPRPILPSIGHIPLHDRFSLKSSSASFPPADSLFACHNHYDAGPTFLRVTTGCLGVNKTLFPTSAWLVPLGHDAADVASVRVKAPLRCIRCKGYVNPYFKLDSNNNIVQCNLCGHRSQYPDKIDPAIINSNQVYTQGIMDFKVTDSLYIKKDYDCVNILIALEMTNSTIEKGIFSSVIQGVKSVVSNHQFDSGVRIGIVTYNQAVSFYKIKNPEAMPVEFLVTDQVDAMCPLSEKQLFFNPSVDVSRDCLLAILDRLVERSQTFNNPNCVTNYHALVSCLSTAFGNHSGRISLFSLNDPINAPGKLRAREKDDIKTPLKPLHNEYRELAIDLVRKRIGLDHFVFGKQGQFQHELATTQYMSLSTGGSINHYLLFSPQINGEHVYFAIYKNLTKECAYDVNFTCRVSNGLTVSSYVIGDGVHEERDISLGMLDSNTSVSVNFQHQEKLSDSAYLQFAMMFTNSRGERIIRIINYKFAVSDKLEHVHQGADYLAVANTIAKRFVNELPKRDSLPVLEDMYSYLVNMLHQYKADRGEAKYSELQIHPNLRNMLPYIHGIISTYLFTNQSRNIPDCRVVEISKINSISFQSFANRYYPKLYPCDYSIYEASLSPGDFLQDSDIAIIPPNLPLSRTSISPESLYLATDSDYIYLIVLPQTSPELIQDLFGLQEQGQITDFGNIANLEEVSHNIRVTNIIAELRRRNYNIYLPLLVLASPTKSILDQKLVDLLKEDNRQRPYLQFLQTIHARVNAK